MEEKDVVTLKRNYGLDFIKFIATLFITNSHYIPLYKDINVGLATFGVHGNALFFFVSGFLLTAGFVNKMCSFISWYSKRLKRLLPALVIWSIIAPVIFEQVLSLNSFVEKLFSLNYWFVHCIIVYYLLYYFVGKLLIRSSKIIRFVIFACTIAIAVVYFIMMPVTELSAYHTSWHYILYFSVMTLGGLTYLYKDKIRNSYFDWISMCISFTLYFAIMKYGKGSTDWQYYLQLLALIPLYLFCFYSYKVCSEKWTTILFSTKYSRWILMLIASLTLEIYIVQFDIITDKFNSIFPLNTIFVFLLISMVAWCLHFVSNKISKLSLHK